MFQANLFFLANPQNPDQVVKILTIPTTSELTNITAPGVGSYTQLPSYLVNLFERDNYQPMQYLTYIEVHTHKK